MALSDCPNCWDTPCTCSKGYLGSKNYQYKELKKKYDVVIAELAAANERAEDLAKSYAVEMREADKLRAENAQFKNAFELLSDENDDLHTRFNEMETHIENCLTALKYAKLMNGSIKSANIDPPWGNEFEAALNQINKEKK